MVRLHGRQREDIKTFLQTYYKVLGDRLCQRLPPHLGHQPVQAQVRHRKGHCQFGRSEKDVRQIGFRMNKNADNDVDNGNIRQVLNK